MRSRRLIPFDILVIAYSTFMFVLLVAVGRPFSEYVDELGFYALMIVVALSIVRFVDADSNRWIALLRFGYPVLLFTFFYSMTGGTIFLLHDHWFDPEVTAFERNLFGVNPTLFIDQHLLTVWFTELVMACYFCYYFMIPGFRRLNTSGSSRAAGSWRWASEPEWFCLPIRSIAAWSGSI